MPAFSTEREHAKCCRAAVLAETACCYRPTSSRYIKQRGEACLLSGLSRRTTAHCHTRVPASRPKFSRYGSQESMHLLLDHLQPLCSQWCYTHVVALLLALQCTVYCLCASSSSQICSCCPQVKAHSQGPSGAGSTITNRLKMLFQALVLAMAAVAPLAHAQEVRSATHHHCMSRNSGKITADAPPRSAVPPLHSSLRVNAITLSCCCCCRCSIAVCVHMWKLFRSRFLRCMCSDPFALLYHFL